MAEDMTIDQLARRVGMTVRNVRSHQTRGLLPGPEVRSRTGYYSELHVARLELIKELQEDGLPLRLVERLLAQREEATGRLLALRRTVLTPLQPPVESVTLTPEQIIERFGEYDDEVLKLAMDLGAIVPRSDGTFLAPMADLLDTAERVVKQGVPLKVALRVALKVRRLCEDAASIFVDMVLQEIWMPFDEAGRPEAEWPKIAASIDQVRPLSSEIMLELLTPAIAAEGERVFGQMLREQAEEN